MGIGRFCGRDTLQLGRKASFAARSPDQFASGLRGPWRPQSAKPLLKWRPRPAQQMSQAPRFSPRPASVGGWAGRRTRRWFRHRPPTPVLGKRMRAECGIVALQWRRARAIKPRGEDAGVPLRSCVLVIEQHTAYFAPIQF